MGVPGLGERSRVLRNPPITKLFLAHENLIEEQTNHKKEKKNDSTNKNNSINK